MIYLVVNTGKGKGKMHLSYSVHRVIRTYYSMPECRIQKTQTYTAVGEPEMLKYEPEWIYYFSL